MWFSKILMFGCAGHRRQQRPLDLAAGDVLGVQDAAFGVAAFLAEVQFARAVGAGNLPLGELHAQLDQLGDARRAFLDDRADRRFLAQAGARLERVAHVQLERILFARHGRDAALGVVGVGLGAVLLGDDGHAPVRRDFQRKGKPRDAAAEDQKIKSARHLEPRVVNQPSFADEHGQRHVAPRVTLATGTSVSGSKNST